MVSIMLIRVLNILELRFLLLLQCLQIPSEPLLCAWSAEGEFWTGRSFLVCCIRTACEKRFCRSRFGSSSLHEAIA